MSLATRCTTCGTVFRVVQDQLKVSEGWVRCGRCDAVFNALEGLFDMEREAPPEWKPPTAPAEPEEYRVDVDVDDGREPDRGDEQRPPDPALVDRIDEQIFGATPRRSAFGALTSLGTSDRGRGPDFADARFDTDLPIEALDTSDEVTGPLMPPDSPGAATDSESPEFVLAAERQEQWQSSGRRKLLAFGVTLLGLLLVGQVAHHYRDPLAARFPALEPALGTWCGLAGCTIAAPRRIDDIAVESTALAKATSPADAFRLSIVLRNRGASTTAMPWIDLSLTDAAGQLVARKALSPQDFRVREPVLAAQAEANLQATLATGNPRVAGYTVEIFYP